MGIEEASHLIIRSLSNDHFGDSEERNTRTEISLW